MAAMTRTSTCWLRSDPSGSNSRSCSTRSSFDCSTGLIVPISSRRMVPPSASANLPFLARRGAGKRAPHVAEELRLEQRFGNRGAVHLDEGHVALRASRVNGARDELFAGAGLAGYQHRALGFGDELGLADHVLHRAAAPDDAVMVELFVALVQQVSLVRAQTLMLERPPHDHEQLVDLERFLQVVERAQLHRFDSALDCRVRRHHQNLRTLGFRRCGDELPDEIEACRVRHQVVDDQHVDAPLGQRALRLANAAGLEHVVPLAAQRLAQRAPDFLLVVDQQERAASRVHAGLRAARAARHRGSPEAADRCGFRCRRRAGCRARPSPPCRR